jgi:hypothetical protein
VMRTVADDGETKAAARTAPSTTADIRMIPPV